MTFLMLFTRQINGLITEYLIHSQLCNLYNTSFTSHMINYFYVFYLTFIRIFVTRYNEKY